MKTIIIFFSLLILNFGCANFSSLSEEQINQIISQAKSSKILLVDVYHKHCSTCQLIEPVVENLKIEYKENHDVAFLKYDLSSPFTLYPSIQVAKGLGLEELYRAQRYSGVVLVVDTKSKEVLKTIIGETNPEVYKTTISVLLKKKTVEI